MTECMFWTMKKVKRVSIESRDLFFFDSVYILMAQRKVHSVISLI